MNLSNVCDDIEISIGIYIGILWYVATAATEEKKTT